MLKQKLFQKDGTEKNIHLQCVYHQTDDQILLNKIRSDERRSEQRKADKVVRRMKKHRRSKRSVEGSCNFFLDLQFNGEIWEFKKGFLKHTHKVPKVSYILNLKELLPEEYDKVYKGYVRNVPPSTIRSALETFKEENNLPHRLYGRRLLSKIGMKIDKNYGKYRMKSFTQELASFIGELLKELNEYFFSVKIVEEREELWRKTELGDSKIEFDSESERNIIENGIKELLEYKVTNNTRPLFFWFSKKQREL